MLAMRRFATPLERALRERRPYPGRLLLSAGGFAAAALSFSALGGEILPDPPGKRLATLERPEIGNDSPSRARSPAQQAQSVTVSYVGVATGYRGRTLRVCWALYFVPRNDGLPPARHATACPQVIRPEADEQSFAGEVTVPVPRRAGRWLVRLTICSDDGGPRGVALVVRAAGERAAPRRSGGSLDVQSPLAHVGGQDTGDRE